MNNDFARLAAYGWTAHFASQVEPDERSATVPVRVVAMDRAGVDIAGPDFTGRVPPIMPPPDDDGSNATTVGDWLLVDAATYMPVRRLERKSVFRRKAVGTSRRFQVIAANVDTLFIVTSCNQDFNVARLERYLALARDAGVLPVVVITKADLAGDAAGYAATARHLMPGLLAESLDARSPDEVARLAPWCAPGQTVALVGSSGVGKSTLVNTLTGTEALATAAIRENDARGRHTTTGRSLHRLAAGGWLLDTPGMREVQLAEAGEGIEAVFADIVELAGHCRFADCRHDREPGCAVAKAVADGTLDAGRFERYRNLSREDARNSEAIWDRKPRARRSGKLQKEAMSLKKREP